MPETRTLSGEPKQQIDQLALELGRDPATLVEDAVRHYLKDQRWQRLVERGERLARERGLTEEDVPRLIQEVRAENRERGR